MQVSVGMFYPAYSMIKSKHIQEEVRSTVMNYFRIPLNAFVAVALIKISEFSSATALTAAAAMHITALVIFWFCKALFRKDPSNKAAAALEEQYISDAESGSGLLLTVVHNKDDDQ
jgi:dipeptide/tripeptide permease